MPRLHYDPTNDYYALLGLTPRATPAQIQQAFHRLAKEVHPDRNPEDPATATARFQALNEAYHVLDDPDLRQEYDRLRWPHARFEPGPRVSEAWPGHGGVPYEASSPRIDEEWFRQARWEYHNWVRSSPPPPAPARHASSLGLRGLLHGPFGWIYLLLAVTILLMPLIHLVITNWVNQAQDWLTQVDPTAAPPACVAPDAIITAPQEGASVPARFDVLGSAAPPDFAEYRLELSVGPRPLPAEDSGLATAQAAIAAPVWAVLIPPAQTPVTADVLAAVDLAGRAPGVYVLRLSVRLADGRLLPPCERTIRYDAP